MTIAVRGRYAAHHRPIMIMPRFNNDRLGEALIIIPNWHGMIVRRLLRSMLRVHGAAPGLGPAGPTYYVAVAAPPRLRHQCRARRRISRDYPVTSDYAAANRPYMPRHHMVTDSPGGGGGGGLGGCVRENMLFYLAACYIYIMLF